jgi:hypothetical protein
MNVTAMTKYLAVMMLATIMQPQVPGNASDFSELLRKMDEPSISELATDPTAEAYRLIYDEAKRIDGPVLVRVELNKEGTATVVTKWLVRRQKPESRRQVISKEEFRSVSELVEKVRSGSRSKHRFMK